MAMKRKICDIEIGDAVEKKPAIMEDRLSNLPDDLQLRIISSLNTKEAFKTSILSKTWASLWSRIPVLNFSSYAIYNLYVFDKFVNRVLRLRDRSAKLDRLTFSRRGTCSAKILKNVFEYAFSHGVKKLEAYIYNSRNHTWPVCLHTSFESVTSLKLQSTFTISCPYLGPSSGSFKNLTVLYLYRALITDLDPFSGFPVLEKLTLVHCDISSTEGKTLNVHALNLSELTILTYQNFNCCELTTPRLKFLDLRGCDLPLFQTQGLPVLDKMVFGFYGCHHINYHKKITFDNLISLFCTLDNVKSLMLFWFTVEILFSFQEELVRRSSPFRNLKKLVFRYGIDEAFKSSKIAADVKAYLLQNSPDAEFTMSSLPKYHLDPRYNLNIDDFSSL